MVVLTFYFLFTNCTFFTTLFYLYFICILFVFFLKVGRRSAVAPQSPPRSNSRRTKTPYSPQKKITGGGPDPRNKPATPDQRNSKQRRKQPNNQGYLRQETVAKKSMHTKVYIQLMMLVLILVSSKNVSFVIPVAKGLFDNVTSALISNRCFFLIKINIYNNRNRNNK